MDPQHCDDDGTNADLLQSLDDACLTAVLSHLPTAKDLVQVELACKRLSSAAANNTLWLKYIHDDFGLRLVPAAAAAAGTSHAASAQLLYKLLRQARPYALQAQAVCTDGGCDEPFDAYWAGNLFVPKRSIMYCSAANTRNVHVFARLCPSRESNLPAEAPPGPSSDTSPTEQLQGGTQQQLSLQQQQQLSLQQQQQQGVQEEQQLGHQLEGAHEARRELLLSRCSYAAKHLIAPEVVVQYKPAGQPGQQQQGGGGGGGVGDVLRMVFRRFQSGVYDNKLAAAAAALRCCSTEGLADFFIAAYLGQQLSSPWALALFSHLSDEQIQHVHEVAFELWGEINNSPTQHRHILLPMPPPPAGLAAPEQHAAAAPTHVGTAGGAGSSRNAGVAGAVGGAGSTAGVTAAQQPVVRQLLCSEEQLAALSGTTAPGQNTCIVHECILARDGLAGSTCPVSAGMIFLGHYQHRTPAGAAAAAQHDSHISTSSSNSTTAPLPGTAAAAAAAAAATASLAAQAAAAALGAMSQQGWLAASNNLTTASAVFLASHAGLLPPVLDYATAGAAEFIEFAPPSQEQLRQQQQQDWAKSAGSSGGSSSSHAAAVCPASGFAAPVLWFRFIRSAAEALEEDEQEDEEEDDEEEEEEDEQQVEEQAGGQHEQPQGEHVVQQGSIEPHSTTAGQQAGEYFGGPHATWQDDFDASVEEEQAPPGLADSQVQQDAPVHVQQSVEEEQAPPGLADLQPAAVMTAQDLEQLPAQRTAALPATADDSSAAAAAAVVTQPRVVPPGPLCPQAQDLPAVAPEVAAALGWQPDGATHPGMLSVRLTRPRAANLMCVKLLEGEDVKPTFNRSRGGCNIDMQLVMLRGHSLDGVLPPGLLVAEPSQWWGV